MRKIFSILLISILVFNLAAFGNNAHAISTYKKVTKYHLDLGCVHVWTDGSGYSDPNTATYQNGIAYNSSQSFSTTLSFSDDIQEVKKAYILQPGEFEWENTDFYSFNSTKYLADEDSYRNNYYNYVCNNISSIKATLSGSHTINLSYTAKLKSEDDYDLATKLNSGGFASIIELLGGKSSVKKDLYNLLEDGDEKGVGEGVFAYIFFVPIVVEYQVIEKVEVPVGDFVPGLDVPASANTGESFMVTNTTVFGDPNEFAETKLQYSVDGGTKKEVTEWDKTTLNANINQSFNEPCTVTYYLTVWNKYGESKSVKETIKISNDKEINGEAVLRVEPKRTHETHPVDAYDESSFEVDGESYSAKRAYKENIARNYFKTSGGTVKRDSDTSAILTYPKKGTYPVTLNVKIKSTGERLSATDNVIVEKTPYIYDSLGGFQKQNRKQILTLNIATAKDKPIVDYDIRIKDLKSNEIINLTKNAPQENGACIKTRIVKEEVKNEYWTTFTVEFLTKYPRYSLTGNTTQNFSYRIKVTDSKGDTDEAYKQFEVAPDKPPIPLINMQTNFIRNKGTNTARLEAADGSQSDGDQLLRTWSVANHNPQNGLALGQKNTRSEIPKNSFIDATTINGYENLAFGTNQTIGWNKEGVGKTTVKLHVKDVWNEPTLEEYIKPSDYLESETITQTEVINIAPKISIEPLETLKANLLLICNKEKQRELKNRTNEIQTNLIENGIDANISIVPVSKGYTGNFKTEQKKSDTNTFSASTAYENIAYFTYCKDAAFILASIDTNKIKNSTKWSYNFNGIPKSNSLFLDQIGKYLIFSSSGYNYDTKTEQNDSNYTAIFDANSGAFLYKTKDLKLTSETKIYVNSKAESIYTFNSSGIHSINLKNGKIKNLSNLEISESKYINNNVEFIMQNSKDIYLWEKCTFNLESEELKCKPVVRVDKECIEQLEDKYLGANNIQGHMILDDYDNYNHYTFLKNGRDTHNAGVFYNSNTNKMIYKNMTDHNNTIFLVKDKKGEAKYICLSGASKHSGSKYGTGYCTEITILDLNGNKIASYSQRTKDRKSERRRPNLGYYNDSDNKIYLIQTGEFDWRHWVYNLNTSSFEDLGNTIGTSSGFLGDIISFYDGGFTTSYNFTRGRGFGVISKGSFPITQSESLHNSIEKYVDKYSNTTDYIANYGLDISKFKYLNEYAKENLSIIIDNTSIDKIGNKIKGLGKQNEGMLHITGTDTKNKVDLVKKVTFKPGTEYLYSYKVKESEASNKDILNFEVDKEGKSAKNSSSSNMYKEVIEHIDFGTDNYIPKNSKLSFSGGSIYDLDDDHLYISKCGYGFMRYTRKGHQRGNSSCSVNINLEKDGYLAIEYSANNESSRGDFSFRVDGVTREHIPCEELDRIDSERFIKIPKGKHELNFSLGAKYGGVLITDIEIGYLTASKGGEKRDVAFEKTGNDTKTVKGIYKSQNEIAYSKDGEAGVKALTAKQLSEQGYMTVRSEYSRDATYSYSSDGTSIIGHYINEVHYRRKHHTYHFDYKTIVTLKAPTNKILVCRNNTGCKILAPNQTWRLDKKYEISSYRKRPTEQQLNAVQFYWFQVVEIPVGLMDVSAESRIKYNSDSINSTENINVVDENGTFYIINSAWSKHPKLERYISGRKNKDYNYISLSSYPDKLDAYVSDLEIKEKKKSNAKGLLTNDYFNKPNSLKLWTKKATGNADAKIELVKPAEKDEDAPLVYKKGQLVKYNIHYVDYEKDPSKKGYWLYAHTPYNDGEHQNAAIVYDEDGNIQSVCGQAVTAGITIERALEIAKSKGLKILQNPIDRFYVDGKYTVYHWEYDDTSRGNSLKLSDGSKAGYPLYDKVSNTAELTFYIEGGASAPWITGISTSPAKVKENMNFSINVGIDDLEKDTLNLTTEVYKDKKLIFTHRKKNIHPLDSAGNPVSEQSKAVRYPVTNTGALPQKAESGKYEVVCTVRDKTGAGLGTYKFIVVSEGKITGEVHHTEQWDENRKKYNINRFRDEINKSISYAEYMRLREPRTRGTNVFWSGEKFMLNAGVAGIPRKVTCSINGTTYKTSMKNSGKKNAKGEFIYTGILWDKNMINKWGRKKPIELTFTFTAIYSGGAIKKHEAKIIVDNMQDYWRLHRAF